MSSFLSPIQKATIDSNLDRLHDTFGVDIYVYIAKQEDTTSDSEFNALYGTSNTELSASYTRILVRHTIKARVKYFPNQVEGLLPSNLPDSRGKVRIKISPEDYEKVKICTKIEIDDVFYQVDGDAAIEGMFSNNYYTIYLSREN
jgi:hypothetical protein